MNVRKVGIWAGAGVSVAAMTTLLLPLLRSDSLPWAGVDRVEKTRIELDSKIVQDNNGVETMLMDLNRALSAKILVTIIVPLHSRECEARRAKDFNLVQSFADQVADVQTQYHIYTGSDYPLPACP